MKQLTLINQIKPKHIMNHDFYIFIMNDIEKNTKKYYTKKRSADRKNEKVN